MYKCIFLLRFGVTKTLISQNNVLGRFVQNSLFRRILPKIIFPINKTRTHWPKILANSFLSQCMKVMWPLGTVPRKSHDHWGLYPGSHVTTWDGPWWLVRVPQHTTATKEWPSRLFWRTTTVKVICWHSLCWSCNFPVFCAYDCDKNFLHVDKVNNLHMVVPTLSWMLMLSQSVHWSNPASELTRRLVTKDEGLAWILKGRPCYLVMTFLIKGWLAF